MICASLFPMFLALGQATYYVDAVGGNDAANGTSTSTAWKTLSKVNGKTFIAGDTILFKSGCTWTGTLSPKGSGNASAPIVIDVYGGPAQPIIDGNGANGTGTAAVYFNNQQYWELNNLEIVNDGASGADRRGVYITASNFGMINHWVLKNLSIHNVKGLIGNTDTEKKTGGIGIVVTGETIPTRFDDILIDGCTIAYCDNEGFFSDGVARTDYPKTAAWMNRRFTNVRISNNIFHHISKNAMLLRLFDGGVVEHNLFYNTATGTTGNTICTMCCDGTVCQYNEGYLNQASLQGGNFGDGSLYDADLRSPNTIWQYSYSHDNSHGLFWVCTVQQDSGIICRYNISQNDKGNIFCLNYPDSSIYIYNNTVYLSGFQNQYIISERNNGSPQYGTRRTYYFYNNIIFNNNNLATYLFQSANYTRTIDYNIFYSINPSSEPADAHKLTTDPKLVNPSSGVSLTSVDGYKLQLGSPAIGSGKVIPNNGGKDYWGYSVSPVSAPSRGAHEYQGTLAVEMTSFTAHAQKTDVTLQWTTATETNNFGFTVERRRLSSAPSDQNWRVIGTVTGFGSSHIQHIYSFTDHNLVLGRYAYLLKQTDTNGSYKYVQSIEIEVGSLPMETVLHQNYPNPFNPVTTITYELPVRTSITLELYNLRGQRVQTLVDSDQDAGLYTVLCNASTLSSGEYFYSLKTNSYKLVKKMMVLK